MPSFFEGLIGQNKRNVHGDAILHDFPFFHFDGLIFDPCAGDVL